MPYLYVVSIIQIFFYSFYAYIFFYFCAKYFLVVMVSDNLKILLVLSIVFMYQIQIYFLNRSQIEVLLSRTTSHMPHPMPITFSEKNGNSGPLWCVVEFPKMSSSTTR